MWERGAGIVWFCVSLFVMYQGWKVDIGTLGVPGPGFLPFWAGCVLGMLSIAITVSTIVKREMADRLTNPWKGVNWRQIIGVSVSLLAYSFIFRYLAILLQRSA
jgi:hypothetical protein